MKALNAPIVAIVSAGEMGAGLASRLVQSGCRVLTHLEGRSDTTRRRAENVGMEEASLEKIATEAAWILSVLPPAAAETFADDLIGAFRAGESVVVKERSPPPVFVDCNAKSPQTAKRLSECFSDTPIPFIDACILGLPPNNKGHDPVIYASCSPKHIETLESFSLLERFGLKIKLMKGENSDVGDASAMKMSFSVSVYSKRGYDAPTNTNYKGIMKGMVGVYETMILAAHAYSPAVAEALIREMSHSLPSDLRRVTFYVPNTFGKAYRFVKEMNEMEEFVATTLPRTPAITDPHDVSEIYAGLASTYQHIADSVAGREDALTATHTLQSYVTQGLDLLDRSRSPNP